MKKWIAALLACLIALLPVFSLADSNMEKLLDQLDDGDKELVVSLTMAPGEALQNALIKSLMSSLSLKMNLREDLYGLTLLIDGGEALTAQLRKNDSTIYAMCNAIGTDIYCLSATTAAPNAAAGLGLVEADKLKLEKLTQSSIHEIFSKLVDEDEEMLKWYEGVLATATTEQGSFSTELSDPAITKLTVPVTSETLKAALDTKYVKEKLTDGIQGKSDEEAAQQAQKQIDDWKAKLDGNEINATVTCLLAEKDIPVSLSVELHRKSAVSDTQRVPVTELCQVDKKTTADGTLLTGSASHTPDGASSPTITAGGTVQVNAAGNAIAFDLNAQKAKQTVAAKGTLGKTDAELTGTIALTLTKDGKTTTVDMDGLLSVLETGINGVATLSVNGTTLGKVNVRSELTAPSATFDKLLAATPETSLQPANMSAEELSTMNSNIQTNLLVFLLTLTGKLPTEAISGLMDMLIGK